MRQDAVSVSVMQIELGNPGSRALHVSKRQSVITELWELNEFGQVFCKSMALASV